MGRGSSTRGPARGAEEHREVERVDHAVAVRIPEAHRAPFVEEMGEVASVDDAVEVAVGGRGALGEEERDELVLEAHVRGRGVHRHEVDGRMPHAGRAVGALDAGLGRRRGLSEPVEPHHAFARLEAVGQDQHDELEEALARGVLRDPRRGERRDACGVLVRRRRRQRAVVHSAAAAGARGEVGGHDIAIVVHRVRRRARAAEPAAAVVVESKEHGVRRGEVAEGERAVLAEAAEPEVDEYVADQPVERLGHELLLLAVGGDGERARCAVLGGAREARRRSIGVCAAECVAKASRGRCRSTRRCGG